MRFRHMAALLLSSFGARVVGAALGLATQVLLARNFAQSDVGTVFLTMSLASLLSIATSLGYPALALTQLPQYFERNQNKAGAAFHALFLRDGFILTLALAVVLYVCSLVFPVHQELRLAFIFGFLSSPFSALIYYNCSVANSARQFILSSVSDNIMRPGFFFIAVLLGVFIEWQYTIQSILLLYVGSNVLTCLLQYFALGERAYAKSLFATHKKSFDRAIRPRAVSLAIVTGLSVAIADIITFLSGVFLAPADVAIVGVAIRLAAIAGFAIQSTNQFVLPDLTKALASDDREKRNNILIKSTALTSGSMVVALLGGLAAGTLVLSLLGEEYAAGRNLLLLFLVSQGIRALSGLNQYLLSAKGHQNLVLYTSVVAFMTLCASWLIFVPQFGLIGVGLAVIMMELVSCVSLAILAKTKTDMRADFFAVLSQYLSER